MVIAYDLRVQFTWKWFVNKDFFEIRNWTTQDEMAQCESLTQFRQINEADWLLNPTDVSVYDAVTVEEMWYICLSLSEPSHFWNAGNASDKLQTSATKKKDPHVRNL